MFDESNKIFQIVIVFGSCNIFRTVINFYEASVYKGISTIYHWSITTPGVHSRNYWFSAIKKQTKLPIELWTLKQEMETVDNHATMRKSFPWSRTYFSLATLTYFLLISRKMWSKSCGKVCNLVLIFESVLRSDLLVSLWGWEISSKVSLLKGHILSSISWNHFHLIWISFLFKGSSCGCVWRPRDLAQLVSFF